MNDIIILFLFIKVSFLFGGPAEIDIRFVATFIPKAAAFLFHVLAQAYDMHCLLASSFCS